MKIIKYQSKPHNLNNIHNTYTSTTQTMPCNYIKNIFNTIEARFLCLF